MENHIITVSREFGSGGHEIGEKLASFLGVPCYDKEMLARAADEMGLNSQIFEEIDEAPPTPSAFSAMMSGALLGMWRSGSPLDSKRFSDRMFDVQTATVRGVAEKGSCVIIGRCSDYILADHPNCTNIFIYAGLEQRIARICRLYGLKQADARQLIDKADKERANHYNYYTDRAWGRVENYHLCLDSGIGVAGAVKVIAQFSALRMAQDASR